MSEEQNTTENVANLENLSPRELRENIASLQKALAGMAARAASALHTVRELENAQPALVRTLQQKIVNQRKQLKALQKAYDEQSKRVSAFEIHCGLCQNEIKCDCTDCGEDCDCSKPRDRCGACGMGGVTFEYCSCVAATNARDYKGIAEAMKGEVTA